MDVEGLHHALLSWAEQNGRDLPWRRTRDPWAILVSELMLQQTQVARVVPKYEAFMERFPTPTACAQAPTSAVVEAWAGLGYNRRAVNLHRAAQSVTANDAGALPGDLDGLLALPGVGPYTARAVLVFAHEKDVGVVDTNVGRVLARWRGQSMKPAELQALADELVPSEAGWAWNQALFDLGSSRCGPRSTDCASCCVRAQCAWKGIGDDPATAPARQSRFEGSDRQARGRLVDAMRQAPVAESDVAAAMGWADDEARAERVLQTLLSDGLAVRTRDAHVKLPGVAAESREHPTCGQVGCAVVSEVSISQARRLALGAQGLGESRPLGRVDRRHMRKVMDRLKLIQLDSVPVVVRTQYMPFFSRLGPYRAELFDETAYVHDEWFEAWAHEASVVPVQSEPLLRWDKRRASEGQTWKGLVRLAKEEPRYVQSILDEVAEAGPLLTSQLSDPRPREGEWWGSRSLGQLALDWLFRIGAVGVRRSLSFEKQFDLLERIVPNDVLAVPTPSDVDAMKELICQGAAAHGVGTANDLVDYFRLPLKESKALIPELVEDGRLIECRVQGWDKAAYRHPDAKLPRTIRAQALLSPFDPVCWYRDRALRLFDFHYRIEIYVPKDKRVFGYYVLPFLLGDNIAARFDLKTDRGSRVLEVRGAFVEDGEDSGEVAYAAAQELRSLAALVGVDDVVVADNGNLASCLQQALR